MFERFQVVSAADVFADENLQPYPENVADRLRAVLTALDTPVRTAVIESDYTDVDYSASYYDQRGRSFTPDRRVTKRIHFFAAEFSEEDFVEAGQDTARTMQDSYLGFAVLRPETPVTLGRTFIACPTTIGGRPVRFPTRSTTPVDLAGIPLEVESCPYMSQDAKIMVCATAAVWMSTANLVDKMPSIAAHTTAEITAVAMSLDRPFGPAVVRRGLSIVEMEQAFIRMGFDPRRHEYPNADRVVEICHLFSDSGIPPVLGITIGSVGHAVTVVGYTLGPPPDPIPAFRDVASAHQYVPYLVIHDDQRGMYLLAELENDPVDGDRRTAVLTIHAPNGPERARCTAILVPFPRRVMLDALEVTAQAGYWIEFGKRFGVIAERKVVSRKLLVRSNSYKETLLENRRSPSKSDGYPKELVDFARALPMPRYVWLIEISYVEDWDPTSPTLPPVIAEFVLDSTLTEDRRPAFLMAHFPGLILGNVVTESGVEVVSETVLDDRDHPPFPDIPRP